MGQLRCGLRAVGIKPELEVILAEAYETAVLRAERETRLAASLFPQAIPFDWRDVLEGDLPQGDG